MRSHKLKAVIVFDTVRREVTAILDHLRRPCLALAFLPAPCQEHPATLIFAERSCNVYITGRPLSSRPC